MSSIDLQALIPNNVGLGENRQMQRALEHWQPAFLNWCDGTWAVTAAGVQIGRAHV